MTISSAPPPTYPPRRGGCGSGCLWGCLIAIVLVSVPVLFAGGWGYWFWTDGYKKDPTFRLVMELVRHDGMAAQVLGDGPVLRSIDNNNFSWVPGLSHHDYDATLQGAKGEGHLSVKSHDDSSGPHIDSAILTGPDGRRYDLLKHQILPGNGTDTSI